jgi:tellurite resistance protein
VSTTARPVHSRPRLTIDLFSMPLGVAALGTSWTVLAPAVPAAMIVADILEAAAAIAWAVMTVVYIAHLIRDRHGLADLRHPVVGPLAAYIPVIGIIIATHYRLEYDRPALDAVIVGLGVLLLVVAAWLLRTWVVGEYRFDGLHPGYLLPLVAGPFVASVGLSVVGLTEAAWCALGVGLFFWVVIGTGVLARLVFGSPLPDGARPTVAILLSPPATAASAVLVLTDGRLGAPALMIVGILLVVIVAQLMLLPYYWRTPFSLGFWAFTFPLCATVTVAVRVVAASASDGGVVASVVLVALATAVVGAIAVRSFIEIVDDHLRHG